MKSGMSERETDRVREEVREREREREREKVREREREREKVRESEHSCKCSPQMRKTSLAGKYEIWFKRVRGEDCNPVERINYL